MEEEKGTEQNEQITMENQPNSQPAPLKAKESGQNIVIDLEFADLMTTSEIHSLVQQLHLKEVGDYIVQTSEDCVSLVADLGFVDNRRIMYCYAVNGRCTSPGHLWLTGCRGGMENQLQRLPGFDKWIIEKESQSYIDALQDQKENMVYLTADSETVLDELDLKKIYIIGGLVDRNRWKGITMKKANEQGIQTAKLPIGSYLKMSSSQVLTVNQVVEILLKFVETKDWKVSFFQVIPQRKRGETDSEDLQGVDGEELENEYDQSEKKKQCIEVHSTQQN
ncbi:hypothetical protein DKX38_008787 [Salix brachista]|uniref:tRNA (guanine(9)-N(1))-methyltransferase n=1 Tax=Salix brachista TaxID=2182728 RepID=A0A5N5MBM6_9ROSI|nr:hypothetical protein DKX38_008787 [Salix brachista]